MDADPTPTPRTLTGEPGPPGPVTLRVVVECPHDDRKAIARTLRQVADDVELGVSNECRGAGPTELAFDFDITFGPMGAILDGFCRDPEVAVRKVAAHRVGEATAKGVRP